MTTSTEIGAYRSSMEASTDVKADARGNRRSTSDSNDGSGDQLAPQLQERETYLMIDPPSTRLPSTAVPHQAGHNIHDTVSAAPRHPITLANYSTSRCRTHLQHKHQILAYPRLLHLQRYSIQQPLGHLGRYFLLFLILLNHPILYPDIHFYLPLPDAFCRLSIARQVPLRGGRSVV